MLVLLTPPGQDVAAQLGARYAKWDKAYLARDMKTLTSMLHPEFRLVTLDNRTFWREKYLKLVAKAKVPDMYKTTVTTASGDGYMAHAWTTEHSRLAGGPERVHRYRDVWMKVKGHWLLQESRTLGEDQGGK